MNSLRALLEFLGESDNWWGSRGIVHRTQAHVWLSLVATMIAVALALPPAVWLAHRRIGESFLVAMVNVGRAIPSFAIIALVLPFSLRYGFGLGFWPTCVALVVLGLPPVFTNSYAGVAATDPGVVEAARASGMRPGEILRSVEIASGLPLIVTGLRICAVQIVATATLGALVGFQGLGSFIVEGLAQGQRGTDRLWTGALGVAILSIATEVIFSLLERRLTPWRRGRRPAEKAITPDRLDAVA